MLSGLLALPATLSRALRRFGYGLLTRPTLSLTLALLMLFSSSAVIYYVQRTLLEIEEALPIKLSQQERDIRLLVNEMGRLVQDIQSHYLWRGVAADRCGRTVPGRTQGRLQVQ